MRIGRAQSHCWKNIEFEVARISLINGILMASILGISIVWAFERRRCANVLAEAEEVLSSDKLVLLSWHSAESHAKIEIRWRSLNELSAQEQALRFEQSVKANGSWLLLEAFALENEIDRFFSRGHAVSEVVEFLERIGNEKMYSVDALYNDVLQNLDSRMDEAFARFPGLFDSNEPMHLQFLEFLSRVCDRASLMRDIRSGNAVLVE